MRWQLQPITTAPAPRQSTTTTTRCVRPPAAAKVVVNLSDPWGIKTKQGERRGGLQFCYWRAIRQWMKKGDNCVPACFMGHKQPAGRWTMTTTVGGRWEVLLCCCWCRADGWWWSMPWVMGFGSLEASALWSTFYLQCERPWQGCEVEWREKLLLIWWSAILNCRLSTV